MWKNTVVPGSLQMTIWRMRIAYLRLQTHTQVMKYLLLLHYNSCCTNSPQRYVVLYRHWLYFVQRQEQTNARDSRRLDLPSCNLKRLLLGREIWRMLYQLLSSRTSPYLRRTFHSCRSNRWLSRSCSLLHLSSVDRAALHHLRHLWSKIMSALSEGRPGSVRTTVAFCWESLTGLASWLPVELSNRLTVIVSKLFSHLYSSQFHSNW